MISTLHNYPFDYIIIDNLYNDAELSDIKNEIEFLSNSAIPASNIDTSIDKITTLPLANNFAVDIDSIVDKSLSKIINNNRKILSNDISELVCKLNPSLRYIKFISDEFTHINYYFHDNYYRGHWNKSQFTVITSFHHGEVYGNLHFDEFDYSIPLQENRTIIIPGGILHSIPNIKAINNSYLSTMTQFLLVR